MVACRIVSKFEPAPRCNSIGRSTKDCKSWPANQILRPKVNASQFNQSAVSELALNRFRRIAPYWIDHCSPFFFIASSPPVFPAKPQFDRSQLRPNYTGARPYEPCLQNSPGHSRICNTISPSCFRRPSVNCGDHLHPGIERRETRPSRS